VGTVPSLDSQCHGALNQIGGFSGGNVDTLDEEFLESGIDALMKLSLTKGVQVRDLSDWAITQFIQIYLSIF
jgi:hypothetical protein